MFIAPLFLRPGQQLKTFEVFRKGSSVDDDGWVTLKAQPDLIDAVRGTITDASQREKFQWGQMGHPITHKIVIRGRTKADATDEIHLGDRRWTVEGKHDPVELGFFSTLFCNERLGVTPPKPDAGGEEETP